MKDGLIEGRFGTTKDGQIRSWKEGKQHNSHQKVTSVLFATPSEIINLEQTHADVVVSIGAWLFGFLRMLLCLLVAEKILNGKELEF
ncbi:hypothetical protein HanXRQr2_Chr07g0294141 [Helianthus annuus]|nr:hypothetical protein HanXRQr2_Chr07g0294141 [Helianthus annuus]KAJ0904650.1 hypothetical protein HanPSC8_Chr07g0284761 [Helianthus annuus]